MKLRCSRIRPLADQGIAAAQESRAIMYANGPGAPEDYLVAVTWLRKAKVFGAQLLSTYAAPTVLLCVWDL